MLFCKKQQTFIKATNCMNKTHDRISFITVYQRLLLLALIFNFPIVQPAPLRCDKQDRDHAREKEKTGDCRETC